MGSDFSRLVDVLYPLPHVDRLQKLDNLLQDVEVV